VILTPSFEIEDWTISQRAESQTQSTFICTHNETLTVVARSIDLALIFQLRRLGDDFKACSR